MKPFWRSIHQLPSDRKAKKGRDRNPVRAQTTLTSAGTLTKPRVCDQSDVEDSDADDDNNDSDNETLDGPTDAFIDSQLRFIQDKIVSPLVKRVKRRATSASILWADAHADKVKLALNGSKKIGVWRRTVADLWTALSPEDQAHYVEQAKTLKNASSSGALWLEYVIFAEHVGIADGAAGISNIFLLS